MEEREKIQELEAGLAERKIEHFSRAILQPLCMLTAKYEID